MHTFAQWQYAVRKGVHDHRHGIRLAHCAWRVPDVTQCVFADIFPF
ncbi:hypothetical protein XHC_3419 [Xanthomonas hortorum pv. carotae str. M081]|nr:hypothetical protein XHC_3419 [Xanthomonas hortorum pv. carotae str. M081]